MDEATRTRLRRGSAQHSTTVREWLARSKYSALHSLQAKFSSVSSRTTRFPPSFARSSAGWKYIKGSFDVRLSYEIGPARRQPPGPRHGRYDSNARHSVRQSEQ